MHQLSVLLVALKVEDSSKPAKRICFQRGEDASAAGAEIDDGSGA
jgi:hypothetical protein